MKKIIPILLLTSFFSCGSYKKTANLSKSITIAQNNVLLNSSNSRKSEDFFSKCNTIKRENFFSKIFKNNTINKGDLIYIEFRDKIGDKLYVSYILKSKDSIFCYEILNNPKSFVLQKCETKGSYCNLKKSWGLRMMIESILTDFGKEKNFRRLRKASNKNPLSDAGGFYLTLLKYLSSQKIKIKKTIFLGEYVNPKYLPHYQGTSP